VPDYIAVLLGDQRDEPLAGAAQRIDERRLLLAIEGKRVDAANSVGVCRLFRAYGNGSARGARRPDS
jgi:hypothetical protein